MNFDRHQEDMRTLRRDNRFKSLAILALAGGLALSMCVILTIVGTERIVFVPPNISKSFWVTKDKVSKDYLEDMGAFVAWLQLDVSPKTVTWKRDVLLKWVAPEDYDGVKKHMDVEADRLVRNNASTFFEPQQLTADENEQSVLITGRLRRQINGVDVGEPEVRTYRSKFKYAGGRVHVNVFKEIVNAQPGQLQVGAASADAVAR
jgi:conjugal transfer pilus assembly protein TraE